MLAFVVVVLIGVAIGLARGGSPRRLARARLRRGPLVVAAVGLQIGAHALPEPLAWMAFGLVVASYFATFAWAASNRHAAGMLLIAAGAALNFAVIVANQGMPISQEAAARAGFAGPSAERLVVRGKHFVDPGGSRLTGLSDVIPLGGQPSAASVGDLVIWAGLILLVQDALVGPRGRRTARARGGSTEGIERDAREDLDERQVIIVPGIPTAAVRRLVDLAAIERDPVEWPQRTETSTLL